MANISIGRFDNLTNFQFEKNSHKIRLWSSPPKTLSLKLFTPISTDGERICFDGKVFSIEEFSIFIRDINVNEFIVLTNKEKLLLLEQGVTYAFDINVLESNFPFFSNIKFNPNLHQTLEKLENCLKRVRQLNVRGHSVGQQTVNEGMHKVERKVRYKKALDSNFFFANLSGYQEVFKLREERQDRTVISLDYNSMYASCMEGDFLDPKHLEYRRFNQNLSKISLPKGFYRVVLLKPLTEYISNFHPFKYSCFQRSFPLKLNSQDEVEIFLFDEEIDYYKRHFKDVYVLDGIVSKQTINHPLFNYASKLYSRRLKALQSKNKTLASLLKLKLAMLHGSTNKVNSKSRIFSDYDELKSFIEREFFISSLSLYSKRNFLELLNDSNYFSIKPSGGKIVLTYRDYRNASNLFSLSARILANARLKMTQTLELLNKFEGLEICYVNIDSVHISIPRNRQRDFFEYMGNMISEKMGDLKVQSIADKGYWLDIGRYWLIENRSVKQFANTGFNPPGNANPFIRKNKKLVRFKSHIFDFCKPYYSSIENSFSFKKHLLGEQVIGTQNYNRFNYEDISTLAKMLNTEQTETLRSLQTKSATFNRISNLYGDVVE